MTRLEMQAGYKEQRLCLGCKNRKVYAQIRGTRFQSSGLPVLRPTGDKGQRSILKKLHGVATLRIANLSSFKTTVAYYDVELIILTL